jgi:hypothetical protein
MAFKTNIFTCCDKYYKDYVPIFILSNLYHNDSCFVEIGVDNMNYEPIQESLKILETMYPNRFLVREVNFNTVNVDGIQRAISGNTVRFITEPVTKSEYVYISDVDIVVLQKDITKIHIKNMQKTGLGYSNVVRPLVPGKMPRMTGLHFTPYLNYYPIPNYSNICSNNMLIYDEPFLYELVKKRFPDFKYEESFRPVHGIHISPNREPFGTPGWGIKNYIKEWKAFRQTNEFTTLEPTLTNLVKDSIDVIDKYCL